MNALRALALLVVSTVCVSLSACGYTVGSLAPDGARKIAVPVFENTTDRHDLEWELTRAVVEELQARTHLVVVAPDDSPDLVLRGALVETDVDELSRRRFLRPRERVLFLGADVSVEDVRNGRTVVDRKRVVERESFSPLVNESVRTAREEAVRALAERIVHTLDVGF